LISFLISAIKIIFLLGFLIFIHEGGHFLVAKLCKIKVNEFAIGFGPKIWQKQGKETKYTLRLIPLGGFNSLEGEEQRSDDERSFSKASIPKRIAIVLAGGLVNIVFGLLVYFILVSCQGGYISNEITEVMQGYGSENVLQTGDKVLKINNQSIHLKSDVTEALEKSNGQELTILIERNGNKEEVKISPTEIKTKNTGIYFGTAGSDLQAKIVALYPGSPAEKQGLQVNDVITKVNGIETNNDPYKVIELLNQASNEEKITFTVERKGETIDITLQPEIISTYYLGVSFKEAENTILNNLYYGFWDTADFTVSIVDNLKMLFTGKVGANQLMGPIGISDMVAKTDGIADFIYLLALISLSLGVTNLLPFPPLDGGKIVIYLIEAIRRKPISEKLEISIQMAGFAVLILLSLYVTYNDILRIF